jgi:hypothetical protein
MGRELKTGSAAANNNDFGDSDINNGSRLVTRLNRLTQEAEIVPFLSHCFTGENHRGSWRLTSIR